MSSVSGLDRLVSVPHAMMQANESLYIDDFNLESLQIQQIQQIQLPDMDALRLRSQRLGSPSSPGPTHLHSLMPASHSSGLMPASHHHIGQEDHNSVHDHLRLLPPVTPCSQHSANMIGQQQHSPSSTIVSTQHTLTSMKYPGTPPDTPPCSSSPSPPYPSLTSVTSGSVPAGATIGLTDVTELVSWRYPGPGDQVHALDLRGQCDLGAGGRTDKLGEAGAWLSMEYVDTDDPSLRHCTTVISALPPTSSSPTSLGGHGETSGTSSLIDDVQVGEVTLDLLRAGRI